MYGVLADLLAAVHVAYIAYVLVGEGFILVGWRRGWKWARNFWFRATHLLAIGIVVVEGAVGVRCPLTVWEEWLRVKAGQPVTGQTFVGRLLHAILFYEDTPQWVFTALHTGFGAIVLVTLFLCRPHGFAKRRRLARLTGRVTLSASESVCGPAQTTVRN